MPSSEAMKPGTRHAFDLIMVLGMHRSGTSLCSHVLSLLGIDMADIVFANDSNPKGHWERLELMHLHDRVLALFGRGWYGADHPLAMPAGWWAEPGVRAIRDEIVAWLRPRTAAMPRFGFKDPRASLLLPMWREIIAILGCRPRFVVCLRAPAAVAHSVAARDSMPLWQGEYRWAAYNAHLVAGVGGDPVCVIPYDAWFTEPFANLRRLSEFVGSPWDPDDPLLGQAIAGVIDPALRRQRQDARHGGAWPRAMYRQILAGGEGDRLSAEARTTAAGFLGIEALAQPLHEELVTLRRENEAALAAQAALQQTVEDAQATIAGLSAELAAHRARAAEPVPPASLEVTAAAAVE